MWLLRLLLVGGALGGSAAIAVAKAGEEKEGQPANPAIAIYRKWTKQYEEDAKEAESAAKMYAKMSKDAVATSRADASSIAASEMNRVGVNTWAHSAWAFEKMFTNPKPGRAAIAAGKAAAPFNKIVGDYAAAQAAYDGAAQGYSLRVGMDQDLAKKLMTYSNQYKLQGNKDMADTYNSQATLLMTQAENFANVAKSYNTMANKIHAVIPQIQSMAGQAAGYAAYWENPTNDMPAEHVFPFTIVPPLEFVQKSSGTRTARIGDLASSAPAAAATPLAKESKEVPPASPAGSSFLGRESRLLQGAAVHSKAVAARLSKQIPDEHQFSTGKHFNGYHPYADHGKWQEEAFKPGYLANDFVENGPGPKAAAGASSALAGVVIFIAGVAPQLL